MDRAAWHYDAESDTNPPVKHPMPGALWVATATQWPASQLGGRQARSLQTCTNRSTDMAYWPLIDTSLKALHTLTWQCLKRIKMCVLGSRVRGRLHQLLAALFGSLRHTRLRSARELLLRHIHTHTNEQSTTRARGTASCHNQSIYELTLMVLTDAGRPSTP